MDKATAPQTGTARKKAQVPHGSTGWLKRGQRGLKSMFDHTQKSDTILIVISGPRQIRQEVVDKVHSLLYGDELLEDLPESLKNGCRLTTSSSLQVSEGVLP